MSCVIQKEGITIQIHVVQVPNHKKKIIKILQLFQNLKKRDIGPGGLWAVGVFGAGVTGDFVAVLM